MITHSWPAEWLGVLVFCGCVPVREKVCCGADLTKIDTVQNSACLWPLVVVVVVLVIVVVVVVSLLAQMRKKMLPSELSP